MNDDLFANQPWLNDRPRHRRRRRGGFLAFSVLVVAVGAAGAAALTAADWLPSPPTCARSTPLPTVTVTTYVNLAHTPTTRPGIVFPDAELTAEPTWKGADDAEQ